jgi:hypothetical protein
MISLRSHAGRHRRGLVLALVLLATALIAAPALALWSSSGTGKGRARAITLGAPSAVGTACVSALTSPVTVTWTAAPGPGVLGYEIAWRKAAGAYTAFGTSATSPFTTPAGALVALGTYTFSVRATNGAWRSAYAAEGPSRNIITVVASVCR